MNPLPGLAAGPRDADVGADRISEPKVDPTELAASVPPTDRELTSNDAVAHAYFHPCPDRVHVRWPLHDAERQPVTHGVRVGRAAATDVSP